MTLILIITTPSKFENVKLSLAYDIEKIEYKALGQLYIKDMSLTESDILNKEYYYLYLNLYSGSGLSRTQTVLKCNTTAKQIVTYIADNNPIYSDLVDEIYNLNLDDVDVVNNPNIVSDTVLDLLLELESENLLVLLPCEINEDTTNGDILENDNVESEVINPNKSESDNRIPMFSVGPPNNVSNSATFNDTLLSTVVTLPAVIHAYEQFEINFTSVENVTQYNLYISEYSEDAENHFNPDAIIESQLNVISPTKINSFLVKGKYTICIVGKIDDTLLSYYKTFEVIDPKAVIKDDSDLCDCDMQLDLSNSHGVLYDYSFVIKNDFAINHIGDHYYIMPCNENDKSRYYIKTDEVGMHAVSCFKSAANYNTIYDKLKQQYPNASDAECEECARYVYNKLWFGLDVYKKFIDESNTEE